MTTDVEAAPRRRAAIAEKSDQSSQARQETSDILSLQTSPNATVVLVERDDWCALCRDKNECARAILGDEPGFYCWDYPEISQDNVTMGMAACCCPDNGGWACFDKAQTTCSCYQLKSKTPLPLPITTINNSNTSNSSNTTLSLPNTTNSNSTEPNATLSPSTNTNSTPNPNLNGPNGTSNIKAPFNRPDLDGREHRADPILLALGIVGAIGVIVVGALVYRRYRLKQALLASNSYPTMKEF